MPLEFIYRKVKNGLRKINMKLEHVKYKRNVKLPKNIEYFDGGLYDAIYEASCEWGHNTALEYGNLQVTYKELIKKINKVARSLKALGIEKVIVSRFVCLILLKLSICFMPSMRLAP